MKYRILIVEDDLSIQQAMETFLKNENYEVEVASDGEEALNLFEPNKYHLILLDMMLPKKSGQEVLETVRRRSELQPVVVISAQNDEFVQMTAFLKEIDDYITKPFSMNILLLKLSTILKRIYGKSDDIIMVNDVKLYINQYQVYRGNEKIEMTPKEFEILQSMFVNLGKVYSREELLMAIWGADFLGDSRTIDVHIKNIRRKLGNDTIKTIKGIGYKVEKNEI